MINRTHTRALRSRPRRCVRLAATATGATRAVDAHARPAARSSSRRQLADTARGHGLRRRLETPRWRPCGGRRRSTGRSVNRPPTRAGGFRLSGAFDDTSRFRATKDGHIAATWPLPPSVRAPAIPTGGSIFTSRPLPRIRTLSGDYTRDLHRGWRVHRPSRRHADANVRSNRDAGGRALDEPDQQLAVHA